jgi:hypothetical protein
MKKDVILLSQCHKEYTQKFLAVRELYKQVPNYAVSYKLMAKWSCLVDLMTRLHNSIIAEERRKKENGDNGKNKNC